MKALVLIPLLSFAVSAQAQILDFADCEIAAAKVVRQMVLGTSKASEREIQVTVADGFDDNSDLVYEVESVEKVNMGHMDILDTKNFKVVAKGSEDRCEILSVNKVSRN